MARAAFIMDRIMHKIGLHGKSFIPMLIGFGCSVPAIMATRILENRRSRLTTIMVIPLMSCGARLTIYALVIPAFFPENWHGPMMWLIYFIGIVLAIVYAVGSADEGTATLRQRLRANYTPLTGFCIMLFCLIYAPCAATIAMTKQETNSWGWAMFQFFGLTALAYIITLAVYQIGSRIAG